MQSLKLVQMHCLSEAGAPEAILVAANLSGEPIDKPLYIHRQSCYLFGRERRVADVPLDHPSISKQHAILQYRFAPADCFLHSSGVSLYSLLYSLETCSMQAVQFQALVLSAAGILQACCVLHVVHGQLWACQLAVEDAVAACGTQVGLPLVVSQHPFLALPPSYLRSQFCGHFTHACTSLSFHRCRQSKLMQMNHINDKLSIVEAMVAWQFWWQLVWLV